MEWKNKILTYIKNHSPVSYDTLLERAHARGLTDDELDELLIHVHKDKRVRVTSDLIYHWRVPKAPSPTPHLDWVRENYPRPGENGVPAFVMPFPDIDMSWLFLKPAELLEWKACLNPSLRYRRTSRRPYRD